MNKSIKKLIGTSIITATCLICTAIPTFASVNYYNDTTRLGGGRINNTAYTKTNETAIRYIASGNHFSNGQNSFNQMNSSQLNSFFSSYPGGTAVCMSTVYGSSPTSSAYSSHEWSYPGDTETYRTLNISIY
ncbi:hypothetical protein [Clostridium sp. YIM B02506]|nr:hypothetical protein [Clostridium sp. YIM B02506]